MAKRPQAIPEGPWSEGQPAPAAGAVAEGPWSEGAHTDPTLMASGTSATRTHGKPPGLLEQLDAQSAHGAHPYWDKLTDYQEPDFSHPVDAAFKTAGNLGGSLIKGVGDMFMPGGTLESAGHALMHPQDSAKSLVESISGKPYNPSDASILPDPRRALRTGVETAGQGGALAPYAAVAGPLTHAVGTGLKGAGRVAGEMTLGTDAIDRQGARPGAGVSENRIVAMTRPSLQAKLQSRAPQLRAEQMDVLENHPTAQAAASIPTRDIVNAPFLDTIGSKTNYTTGAGSPAEMAQHWKLMEALNYQQDPKGGILRDPVSHQPVPANIDLHRPAEAANFLQNMNGMETDSGSMANTDLRRAGGRLSDAIKTAVPESAELTDRLSNTEAAADVLARQRGAKLHVPLTSNSLTSLLLKTVADPARVTLGSTAAAGLDLLGSGAQRLGDALTPNSGGGQAQPPSANVAPAPQPPTLAGQLTPGRGPLPQGQPSLTSGHVVTPPPAPVAGALPGNVEGPLTRVVTRTKTGFGPKVDAPAFTKPVGYDTSAGRIGIEEENANLNAKAGTPLTDAVTDRRAPRKPGLKFANKDDVEPNQGRRKTDKDGLPDIPSYTGKDRSK